MLSLLITLSNRHSKILLNKHNFNLKKRGCDYRIPVFCLIPFVFQQSLPIPDRLVKGFLSDGKFPTSQCLRSH
jgi:hypothetical protein